jgi:hypothetical protein
MAVDPIIWITSITAFANMVKALAEAHRSTTDLNQLRQVAADAKDHGEFSLDESDIAEAQEMVISDRLLQTFVEDIENAERRFDESIEDPRYTPADVDHEEERAKRMICAHLARIRDYNNGELPV